MRIPPPFLGTWNLWWYISIFCSSSQSLKPLPMRFGEETNILSLFAGSELWDLQILQGGTGNCSRWTTIRIHLRKPRCPLKGGPFPKESSLPNTIFFGRHLTVLGIRSRDIFRWVEIPDYLASYHGRDGLVQSEVQDMFGRVSRHFAKPYKMVFPDPHNSAVLLRTFN